MPHNIFPGSLFTPIVVPSDGDAPNAASVDTSFQTIADFIGELYDNVIRGRTFVRYLPAIGTPANEGFWSVGDGSGDCLLDEIVVSTGSSGHHVVFHLDLPHEATLDQIRMTIHPGSHSLNTSLTNVNLPRWDFFQIHMTTGVKTLLGSGTDSAANSTVYDPIHNVDGSIGTVIDAETFRYALVFQSESGANAITHMKILGVRITFTTALNAW